VSSEKAATSRARISPIRLALWAVVALAIVAVSAVAVALAFSAQPSYFEKYKGLALRHTRLESSSHKSVPCTVCHADTANPVAYDAALVGDFYVGLFEATPTLSLVKFSPPTRAACLSCHRDDWSDQSARTAKVPHPAHLRVADEPRDCVTCHKWVAHEETYQAKHKTMPFSAVCASFGCHVGTKQPTDCVSCHHVLQEGPAVWRATHKLTVAKNGPGGCVEKCHTPAQCNQCHTTGTTPTITVDFTTASATAIGKKHVQPTWMSVHGSLALADPKACTTCHVSEGECQDCHLQRPAFHGSTTTWLKAHQTLGTNTPRCLTCHEQKMCDTCHEQFKQTR
jgi:hypothetical protein